MARGPRNFHESGVFHLMIRGNNKRCVFFKDCEYRYFQELLMRYKRKFQFLLYHYILMKNHVHFSMRATEKTDISKMMQGLELAYYCYYKKRYSYVGHLWQGRFKSNHIADDKYLLSSGLYIEINPVKSGIAKNPADYPWSSYRHYAFGEKNPLIDTSPLYDTLGEDSQNRQIKYQELMQERLDNLTNCNEQHSNSLIINMLQG